MQVVFSEAYWIGTKAVNPEEHKMPMPLSIIEAGKKAQGAAFTLFPRLPICPFHWLLARAEA